MTTVTDLQLARLKRWRPDQFENKMDLLELVKGDIGEQPVDQVLVLVVKKTGEGQVLQAYSTLPEYSSEIGYLEAWKQHTLDLWGKGE